MRNVRRLNISADVKEAITSQKPKVVVTCAADAQVLGVVTIGGDSNSVEPGHYVLIDHAVEGEKQPLSLRLVPDSVPYRENLTVDSRYVGHLYHKNDPCVCGVFHLTGRVKDVPAASIVVPAAFIAEPARSVAEPVMSWAEQDASNS